MFKETPITNETDTIIGPSVKVEGDFITEGNVVVEGMICGTIKTSKNLKVGSKSACTRSFLKSETEFSHIHIPITVGH